MTFLPMGEDGNFCILTEGGGISLLASNAVCGISDKPIDGAVTLPLSTEEAFALGHGLIDAAMARSN
jgi:hypothetical protein